MKGKRGIASKARTQPGPNLLQESMHRRSGWVKAAIIALILALGLWFIALSLHLLDGMESVGVITFLILFTILGPGILLAPVITDLFHSAVRLDALDQQREQAELNQQEREAHRHGQHARQLEVERLREEGASYHVGNDGEIVFEKDKKTPGKS